MPNIELLAPAGDRECLVAAIQNGADAIYLGGTLFNARAFAKNFDFDDLVWAIEYAHLRQVKIYVTVNTLYKDEEFEELINYIDRLYQMQVDALIVQDIGLFHVVRKRYPDFDVHMSTQASVMNVSGAQYFETQGATRVVLARENTIEEIQEICQNTSLEVEVFVHGALCVSYSGQCLMSSFIGKRSGNRGACAQPCRLQYRLKRDNQILDHKISYLLSPKDLMTIDHIGELIDAGVTSFKVEGRMKKPEYVASVVSAYRQAIDAHLKQHHHDFKQEKQLMAATFNRDYTQGFIFHDDKIVEGDYSGNKGVVIGKVHHSQKKNKRVVIELYDDLYQGDSLVFEDIDKGRPINKMYVNNQLVSHVSKGNLVEIEFDYPVYQGNVRKTVDTQVMKQLQKTYDKDYRKQPISLSLTAHIGKPAKLQCIYQGITIIKETECLVEKAQKRALDQERIHQQLSKLGQSVFVLQHLDLDIDEDMTFPIKELNELRRNVVDELTFQLSHQKIHQYSPQAIFQSHKTDASKTSLYVMASTLEQLEIICQSTVDFVVYPYSSSIDQAYKITKKYDKELIVFVPRIVKEKDLMQLKSHPLYAQFHTLIVNDYGAYHTFKEKNLIIGTGLNVYNSYSSASYDMPQILSLEMSQKEINRLPVNHQHCIAQIYGKIENMISEYCPITQYYFGKQKKHCQICKQAQFSLVDRKNECFDLMMDEECRMHLLNCRTLYYDEMYKLNVGGYFIHFTNEDCQMVKAVLDDLLDCIHHKSKSNYKEKIRTTFGYLK